MGFYGLPPIEQKALDGWGTVSSPVGRRKPVGDYKEVDSIAKGRTPGFAGVAVTV
jgi:hypothetical protein